MHDVPMRPKRNSLAGAALRSLLNGHHITHRNHQDEERSNCLAASIHKLRKNGWVVDSRSEVGRTRKGRIASFVRYVTSARTLRSYRAHPDVSCWLGGVQ
jgi:hypothetical protein